MNTFTADIATPEDAKTAILNYIDERLKEWAEWFMRDNHLGIGYPPCSVEYRLMTEGHIAKQYFGLKPMPTHSAAEEIEALMVEMSAQHHKMASVIKYYYLHSGGIRHHARELGISHTHFEMHLNLGRWWLAGRLSTTPPIKRLMKHMVQLQGRERNEKTQK